jgi:hypothetical protein
MSRYSDGCDDVIHKFFTTQVVIAGYGKEIPLLHKIVEDHFNRLHVKEGQVNGYNFYEYIHEFEVGDDFKYELRVEIDDFVSDLPMQHPSPREIIIEHFLQTETPARAHELSNKYFEFLQHHASDYAVTMTRANMLYQVVIVTGLDKVFSLIEEKKADLEQRRNGFQFSVGAHTCARIGETEYTLAQLTELWDRLALVPVDAAGKLETHFLSFEAGSEHKDVLRWFQFERSDFQPTYGLRL